MDRNELINEIASLSADEFSTFERQLFERRIELLRLQLQAMRTEDLQARWLWLIQHSDELGNTDTAHLERSLDYLVADIEVDDTDRWLYDRLARDLRHVSGIASAYSAEMLVIGGLLISRGAEIPELEEQPRLQRKSARGHPTGAKRRKKPAKWVG